MARIGFEVPHEVDGEATRGQVGDHHGTDPAEHGGEHGASGRVDHRQAAVGAEGAEGLDLGVGDAQLAGEGLAEHGQGGESDDHGQYEQALGLGAHGGADDGRDDGDLVDAHLGAGVDGRQLGAEVVDGRSGRQPDGVRGGRDAHRPRRRGVEQSGRGHRDVVPLREARVTPEDPDEGGLEVDPLRFASIESTRRGLRRGEGDKPDVIAEFEPGGVDEAR